MGVDIDGWVEVRKVVGSDAPPKWVGVCPIRELVERNYGMFGALLDVRNNDGFPAPFAHRGLPSDVSGSVSFDFDSWDVGPSWALWPEIDTLWDQIGSQPQARVISLEQLDRERENPLFVIDSIEDTPGGPRLIRSRIGHPDLEQDILEPYRDPIVGSCYVQLGHFTVRELISTGWQACFDIMAALAKNYGGDNVRLVSWCDSQ